MKIKIKTVLYWLSIIRPITDILIGTWSGIKAAIQNAKASDYYEAKKVGFTDLVSDMDTERSFVDASKSVGTSSDFAVIDDYFSKKGVNDEE